MKSLSCGCMNSTSGIRHPTSNVKVLLAQLHAEALRRTRLPSASPLSIASFVGFSRSCDARESASYLVFVSNERSGDVTVIDGATDGVIGTFPVGKRPRGIHGTPGGRHVFVALSGSPRMAPGLDENHDRTPHASSEELTRSPSGVIRITFAQLV